MNANGLRKLKLWREYGGMTEEEYAGWIAQFDTPPGDGIRLHEMETNMALALRDFLMVLGVGDGDIAEVLGPENVAYIEELLSEQPVSFDEGAMAYRAAKINFEPEKSLEEYGLIYTILRLPDAVWDALEENDDDRFIFLGPIVLDQNTRTIWLWDELDLNAMRGPMDLEFAQAGAAIRAMKEAGGGLLELST